MLKKKESLVLTVVVIIILIAISLPTLTNAPSNLDDIEQQTSLNSINNLGSIILMFSCIIGIVIIMIYLVIINN